jgi:3-oxoacyl-[acyl-carrier-protein] synthase-1
LTSQSRDTVVITGIGAVTSTGSHARQAAASIRADICRFAQYPSYEPIVRDPGRSFPGPVIAAPARAVTDGLSGIERLLALGRPALAEALADGAVDDSDLPSTNLFLAGGQRAATGADSRIATVLASRLVHPLSDRLRPDSHHYFPAGSAGALLAIEAARRCLLQGDCRFCVVGGTDSWLDPQTLAEIDQARRLKTAEIQDGFVPGEAAAFVVLERADTALQRHRPAYARCSEVCLAHEANTRETDSVCTGQSLAECLRPVTDRLRRSGSPVRAILCDLNGETYRATEWAYAHARVFRDSANPCPRTLLHPADCVGDVGAATGALLLTFGAWMIKRQPDRWNTSVIWCSSDKGERACCSLEAA